MLELIENIDKLHTTGMGIERIKRNLKVETDDIASPTFKNLDNYTRIAKLDALGTQKRIGIK